MQKLTALAVLFAVAVASSVLRAADKETEIELPHDATAIVIRLEYVGGYGPDPEITLGPDGRAIVEVEKPALEILADGTVLKSGKAAKKMTAAELKKLLAFITVENKFFEFDKSAVDAAVKEKQAAFDKKQLEQAKPDGIVEARELPADMASAMITVKLGKQEKTVECYGLGFLVGWYGNDIKAIRQMFEIENKLKSL